ncbi:MAG TPA: universal stress protein [Roseiflexaceae bacterium]|nr:universal stress protein [Roseiflexaceae bacterium]
MSTINGADSSAAHWPGPVRVMVCVGYNPVSQLLIRRAGQLARAFSGDLLAVHIQAAASDAPGYRAMLEQNLALARELGARVLVEQGNDIAHVLARVAQTHGVTHLVVGESARSRWQEIRTGSLVRQLLRASHGIDVYIVADPA